MVRWKISSEPDFAQDRSTLGGILILISSGRQESENLEVAQIRIILKREETMTKRIREIMTPDPIIMQASDTVADAARVMRDKGIGDVIVYEDNQFCGIVTDRDLTVRVLSERQHPAG